MRRIGRRIAFAASGSLLGLAGGEILVRALGPEIQVVFRETIVASDDPVLAYALRPGSPDGEQAISAAGLRDREYAVPKPDGVVRIAAVGDSITYGLHIPRDRGWTKLLEGLLNAQPREGGPRFEVINLGVPGYNVEQVVARLRAVGLAFEPDAVVYGYSLNDPQGVSLEAEALRTLREAFEAHASAGIGRWLSRSQLYLLWQRIGFDDARRKALLTRPVSDPGFEATGADARTRYFRALHAEGESAERLRRGLDALAALARERRLPVLVVLFPLFGDGGGAGPEALRDVHQIVAMAAVQRGLAGLDLLPVYDAASRALDARPGVDGMHPNRLGHRIAAVALLDWMCRAAWPPGRAPDCSGKAFSDATDLAIERALAVASPPPAP